MGKLPTIKQGSDTMQCSVLDSRRRTRRTRRGFGQNHRPADVSKPPSESSLGVPIERGLASGGRHASSERQPCRVTSYIPKANASMVLPRRPVLLSSSSSNAGSIPSGSTVISQAAISASRSEEHTAELQSLRHL